MNECEANIKRLVGEAAQLRSELEQTREQRNRYRSLLVRCAGLLQWSADALGGRRHAETSSTLQDARDALFDGISHR